MHGLDVDRIDPRILAHPVQADAHIGMARDDTRRSVARITLPVVALIQASLALGHVPARQRFKDLRASLARPAQSPRCHRAAAAGG